MRLILESHIPDLKSYGRGVVSYPTVEWNATGMKVSSHVDLMYPPGAGGDGGFRGLVGYTFL